MAMTLPFTGDLGSGDQTLDLQFPHPSKCFSRLLRRSRETMNSQNWCWSPQTAPNVSTVTTCGGTNEAHSSALELLVLPIFHLHVCVNKCEQSSFILSACDLVFRQESQIKDFFVRLHIVACQVLQTHALNCGRNAKEVQSGTSCISPGTRGDSRATEDSMAPV